MQVASLFRQGIGEIDGWYLENIVCPRDHSDLSLSDGQLRCRDAHSYPVVEGIPVMLVEDAPDTLNVMSTSLAQANASYGSSASSGSFYPETLGISEDERKGILRLDAASTSAVDPVVSYLVAATNGMMYRHLVGRLQTYPIPELPLPQGDGQQLLDIGCSWGRWCFAAARKGYAPVGIDPSLGAVLAARRVAAQFEVKAHFIVGDARMLPFRDKTFPKVFSYSVIQHFSYDDARQTIREVARVLCPKGASLIQLPNAFGIRCLCNQARRRFCEPVGFEVRYWTPKGLRKTFESLIGDTILSADCYFGIGLQPTDIYLMPFIKKNLVRGSEFLKTLSNRLSFLTKISDSLWVKAIRTDRSC